MSSIQKQSVLRSAISYMGMLLGAFSTIFIYPLEIESYGLSQFIYSAAEFMIPMLGLGIPFLTIKYFPYFREEASGHRGFLGILILGIVISAALSGTIIWLFSKNLVAFLNWLGFDSQLFSLNALFIFSLSIITLFTGLLENYLINFNRVLVSSLTNSLLPKIGLPILITGIYFGYINEENLKWGMILIAVLTLTILLIHVKYLGLLKMRIDWVFLRTMPLREMGIFVVFSLVSGVGYILAFRIGSIMVPFLMDTAQNGVYSIGNFIAMAIEVPFISVAAIIAPLFADHISQKEWSEVANLYHRYSSQILIWGVFLFLGAVICIDDLIQLMPSDKKMEDLSSVIWFLGIAKIVNMSVGLNLNILVYSRYFKFTLISVILLAIINVTLNLILIPKLGMVGAAVAILISIVLYNSINVLFFWLAFKIVPYKKRVIGIIALGTISYTLISFGFSFSVQPIISILIRGTALSVLYIGSILWFRLSPELNNQILKIWQRLRKIN